MLSHRVSKKSFTALLLLSLAVMFGFSSCVPLAVGAAGVAGGYIIREKGFGVIDPVDSAGSYDSGDSSGYEDTPVY